jgi:hypothetical protein
MTLLTDQDGGGGCDSTKREQILRRLTILETEPHCPDHKNFATKLDTLDGKVTVLLAASAIAVVIALMNFFK